MNVAIAPACVRIVRSHAAPQSEDPLIASDDTRPGPLVPHMLGGTAAAWSTDRVDAWNAFFELGRRLFGSIESELGDRHDLTMSTAGLLGRLEAAPARALRLSALAVALELSLSRVSRLVDALEARDLVERLPCPSDARAINARITPAGLALVGEAQASVSAEVERLLFGSLDDPQVHVLAISLRRMLEGLTSSVPGSSSDTCV